MKKKKNYSYFKIAIGEIMPNRKIKSSIIELIVAIVFGATLGIWVSINTNTIIIFKNSIEIINNIMLVFIAMEMGAYALFQALLNNELVCTLYKEDKQLLKSSNRSFLGMIILFWMCIIVNAVLLIIFFAIPDEWILFNNSITNVVFSSFCASIYYIISFRVLFEIRNYAINLYKIFEIHNMLKLKYGLEDDDKEEKP